MILSLGTSTHCRLYFEASALFKPSFCNAVHIAAATVHGLDYLLTLNCKHIANAQIQRKLAEISLDLGYELPIICTPYELLGDYNDVAR